MTDSNPSRRLASKHDTTTVDVSVIIVSSEPGELLPLALGHLEVQSYPPAQFEIIVVDERPEGAVRAVVDRFAAGAPVPMRFLQPMPGKPPWTDIEARNRAIERARGRWLLFLDEDLLASPNLVESHVNAQQRHDGNAIILGRIEQHPQIDRRIVTKWSLDDDALVADEGAPVPFHQWRMYNLSVPKEAWVASGGLDEDFAFLDYGDVELAWRMSLRGMQGFFSQGPGAYYWRPIPVAADRQRHYRMGYSLYTLLEKAPETGMRERFRLTHTGLKSALNTAVVPICAGLSSALSNDAPGYAMLRRRVHRYELLRGFRDAAAQRAPLRYAMA